MSRLPLLFFALALAALAIVCSCHHATAVEKEVATDVSAALVERGYDSLAVQVDGQDVTVSGALAEDARQPLLRELGALPGVRVARGDFDTAAPSPPAPTEPVEFSFGLATAEDAGGDRLAEREFVFRGAFGDPAARDAALEAVTQALREQLGAEPEIVDRSSVQAGIESPAWLEDLPNILASVDPISNLDLTGSASDVVLRGEIADDDGRRRVVDSVRSALGSDEQVEVLDRLSIAGAGRVADAPQREIEEILRLGRIEFATNSATITESGLQVVRRIEQVLQRHPTTRIEISGHTDASGSAAYNLDLSQRRADAVRDALASTIDPQRMTTLGFGPQRPIAPNETASGRQRNRRIEFRILTNV